MLRAGAVVLRVDFPVSLMSNRTRGPSKEVSMSVTQRGYTQRTGVRVGWLFTRLRPREATSRVETVVDHIESAPADDMTLRSADADAATPPGYIAIPPAIGLAAQPSYYFRHSRRTP
jgi:hypothetical protein